jgi:choline dehydrogenase-like flavoprotein
MKADVIIVGSGASATSAAFPLARAGLSVLMLDVGNTDSRYASLIPNAPFSEIRRTESNQYRYFLGDDLEGLAFGKVRVGAQLTPPRQFIQKDTERFTPVRSETFAAFESLALGGLAAGWGAVAVEFDDADMAGYPIKLRDLAPHYQSVSARVGISGAGDDLLRYYGGCSVLQPPLDLDSNGQAILSRYEDKRNRLNRGGFYAGRARLAVLSRDLGHRRAQQYHDMDFYADKERSVFRPAFAVEELQGFPAFTYARPYLVQRFREDGRGDGIDIEALHTETGGKTTFSARRLVLAAGALGTARIVLRSLDRYNTAIPFVANPYTYVPCVNLAMLGKPAADRRHSLTQVGAIFEPRPGGKRRVHAQAYSYRSLLLFKIAKESPLPVAAFRVMRDLLSAFVILGIHHEDRPSPAKRCVLRRGAQGGPDVLEVEYRQDPEVVRRQARDEKAILRCFRKLGCWALKRIHPGNGANIHYGGTIPMTEEESELTVTPACRLRHTRAVYLADASVLPYLPAKALTLTLMANAERVGTIVAEELRCRPASLR